MRLCCLVAALLLATTPPAGSAEQTAATMGLGVTTCGEFAKAYQINPADAEFVYFSWAQGYMSGLNTVVYGLTGKVIDLSAMPTSDQQSAIRQYCNAHP